MGPTILAVVLLLLGVILIVWTISQARTKPAPLSRAEKTELARLQMLETKLSTMCMQSAHEPFAIIVLDEILASKNRASGKDS